MLGIGAAPQLLRLPASMFIPLVEMAVSVRVGDPTSWLERDVAM